MDVTPNDEQVLLRDTVRRFLADRNDPATMGCGPMIREDWRALGELGLFGFLLPARGGGMDGRAQDAMIVAEELGRALAITPLAEGIVGAVDLVARYGDAGMIDRWVASAITGDAVLALATGGVSARQGRLTGQADFVPWAMDATALVVLGADAAWVVATDAENLTIEPVRMIDGTVAGMVRFDECVADRVVLPGDATATLFASVQLCHVAEMVGAMATLYDHTVDYVRQRKQFGVAIGTFQVVQHKMARMFVALEQSRSLLLKAGIADRADAGFARGVLTAKAYVGDAAQRLAEDAVQLHGGMGVTDELPVGRALRRIMLLARSSGSTDDARQRLAA